MKRQWLVLWSLWAMRLARQPSPAVRVSGGVLRGEVVPDGSHVRYLNVPYATHPELRFQGPAAEPTWVGVFDAVEENVRCLQRIGKTFMIGRRECLTLNIYTPNQVANKPKPVMVFFHGGGFFTGSASNLLYGPNYLVAKDVILVTVNYRLNIQGFACLKIKEAPGNAGLKDQLAALKWIQRNIKVFGGDPDNVTIFGESAGSVSVSFHVLSPRSKGLFHKAIMQSGSSLSSWALQFKPVWMASLMTKTMGYDAKNVTDIYNILMSKTDIELIVTRVPRRENNTIISELLYSPCVEEEIDGVEAFITETPYNLLSKGNYNKVPIMLGYNGAEGLLFMGMENDTTIPYINFEKSIPKSYRIPSKAELKKMGEKLEKLYLDGDKTNKNLSNLAKFHGEVYLTHPILEETELYMKTNDQPVFSYVFNYDGYRNIPKLSLERQLSQVPNATHADDLFYLFSQQLIPAFLEHKAIDRLTTLWTNFAKYGDPTPQPTELVPVKWLPATTSQPQSLFIDEEFSTIPLWPSESLRYLREVYRKYRRKED
ncbi:esterase FE4-like [Aricia agestis]|uniref:esterase FE4-like n=1 Tax=Aricia agestis TaxID=91739 RepID=UPI001C20A410|nr:esterase FE4-like [Aricia agestis]